MNIKKRIAGRLLFLWMLAAAGLWGCRDQVVYELAEMEAPAAEEGSTEPAEEETMIVVYICGAVKHPGIYELEAGSRVAQAVEAAGGLAEEAWPEGLNQARILTDGEQITVLTREQAAEGGYQQNVLPETGTLVNINTADVSRLTDLDGIGETKAEAILRYREENGKFQSIEEICNVDGIGQGTYEKIKDRITVS